MERSIKLCICLSVVSQAGGNFVSQQTSQQISDKKTYLSKQSWFDDSASWWSIGNRQPGYP